MANNLQQTDIPCNYITLSDYLDMVGLTARPKPGRPMEMLFNYKLRTQSDLARLENICQTPREAGPVKSLLALSKIGFRFRTCDIVKITSLCKSWLYKDMLTKPEEMLPSPLPGLSRTPQYQCV